MIGDVFQIGAAEEPRQRVARGRVVEVATDDDALLAGFPQRLVDFA